VKFWKITHEQRGGHVHLSFFVSNHPDMTYACCGNLCMDPDDFHDFETRMNRKSGVKFQEVAE